MSAPQQLGLLALAERQERPWKRQRATARAVYAELRSTLDGREAQVLRCLAAHWNATQTNGTALELLAWMRERGEAVFDCNSIRPRLHALVQKGAVAPNSKRKCRISGKTVYTWKIREIGDSEPR